MLLSLPNGGGPQKLASCCALLWAIFAPDGLLAATPAEIKAAVDRGQKYLIASQLADGSWPRVGGMVDPAPTSGFSVGITALAGLALAESGIRDSHNSVRGAAGFLERNTPDCNETYSLGTAILFYDRVTTANSRARIQTLASRLNAGQQNGTWGYLCPSRGAGGHVDNSNAQFAVLGLLAAYRRVPAVKTAESLSKAAQHFRGCQNSDGGWAYFARESEKSSGSMTAAGLLGIATQHGVSATLKATSGSVDKTPAEPLVADPLADPAVKAGLRYLEQLLMRHANTDLPRTAQEELANSQVPDKLLADIYFFWSVERTAVLYGIDRIGEVDWYTWGADKLIKAQRPDGSWYDSWGSTSGITGTCFALLFLARSNPAPGLTATLAEKTKESQAGRSGSSSARLQAVDAATDGAEKLLAALEQADDQQREKILQQLHDGKGGEYSDSLAKAVNRLSGPWRERAHMALVSRLTRMTAATLKARIDSEDLQTQLAAIKAAARKGDRELIGDIIEQYLSPHDLVRQAARDALKTLSGEDFGPAANAGRVEFLVAHKKWKAWWAMRRR